MLTVIRRSFALLIALIFIIIFLILNRIDLAFLGVVGALLAVGIIILNLKYPGSFIYIFLISKPLVDLTWQWRFFRILNQDINLQTVLAVYVVMITILILVTMKNRAVTNPWIILFSGFSIFSSLLSGNSNSINELLRLISGISFFITVGLVIKTEASVEKFADLFILVVSVPLVISMLQIAGLAPFEYWDWIGGVQIGRATGSYQHPLDLVYYIIYLMPFIYFRLDKFKVSLRSIPYLAIFLLALLAVYFTYDRTSFVVLIIQMVIWLIIKRQYRILVIVVSLGFLGVIIFNEKIAVLYSNLIDIIQGKIAFYSPDFLRGRGVLWYLFLNSWFTGGPMAWIFGRGVSIASGFVPLIGTLTTDEPHNDFLRILHAYGLAGLSSYLIILIQFIKYGLRLIKTGDPFANNLGGVLILATTSVIILSLTGEPMRYPSCSWYLFSIASIALINLRLLKQKQSEI